MNESEPRPLIGLPACVKEHDGQSYHEVGDKYVRAVAEAAGGLPMVFPALGGLLDIGDLVGRLDGLMLTGSPSNVHPTRYGTEPTPAAEPYDPWRDDTTLPLIHEALRRGVPLLAICRGFQELNVALGGTLHARVHELPGRLDHRRPQSPDLDVQYGIRHAVSFTADSVVAQIMGSREVQVNSLHWQAIDRPAAGLAVEGTAPDGTIEAVRVRDAKNFALAVQWHPEYAVMRPENATNRAIFEAFGHAARARARARRDGALDAAAA